MADTILRRAPEAVVVSMVVALLIRVLLLPFVDTMAGIQPDHITGKAATMLGLMPMIILLAPVLALVLGATSGIVEE